MLLRYIIGSVAIRNTRYSIGAMLLADLVSILSSIFLCYLFFGNCTKECIVCRAFWLVSKREPRGQPEGVRDEIDARGQCPVPVSSPARG